MNIFKKKPTHDAVSMSKIWNNEVAFVFGDFVFKSMIPEWNTSKLRDGRIWKMDRLEHRDTVEHNYTLAKHLLTNKSDIERRYGIKFNLFSMPELEDAIAKSKDINDFYNLLSDEYNNRE